MSETKNDLIWPVLPLNEWIESKTTLHLFLQIIGKIRLKLHPKMNHWWHVTFYPTVVGLTTGLIPYKNRHLSIQLNLLHHKLEIKTSEGHYEAFQLMDGLSVAEFYEKLFSIFDKLEIQASIIAKPFDPTVVKSDKPFADDYQHNSYSKDHIERYWQILRNIYPVFQQFRGQFIGKSTPVHLYWHTMDLAVTRFSGKSATINPEMDPVSREAYSHEVISVGFWPGDDKIKDPTFYSYTYPEPTNMNKQPLQPKQANWQKTNGSSLALLNYHDIIKDPDPQQVLLEFLESAYQAGAHTANWDIDKFKLP